MFGKNIDLAPLVPDIVDMFKLVAAARSEPSKPFIQKDPLLFLHMQAWLDIFKGLGDAPRFVWIHRHPKKCITSLASLYFQLGQLFTFEVDTQRVASAITVSLARGLDQLMDYRQSLSAADDREQFIDIAMHDLVADPVATVQRIYDFYGIVFDERARESVTQYCAANPKSKHPNKFANDDFVGTDVAQVEREFGRYIARYKQYF